MSQQTPKMQGNPLPPVIDGCGLPVCLTPTWEDRHHQWENNGHQQAVAPPPQQSNQLYTYMGDVAIIDGLFATCTGGASGKVMLNENATGDPIYVDHHNRTTAKWEDPSAPVKQQQQSDYIAANNDAKFNPCTHESQSRHIPIRDEKDCATQPGRDQRRGDQSRPSGSAWNDQPVLTRRPSSQLPIDMQGHGTIGPPTETGAAAKISVSWSVQPRLTRRSSSPSRSVVGHGTTAPTTQTDTTNASGSWSDQPWLSRPLSPSPIIMGDRAITTTTQTAPHPQSVTSRTTVDLLPSVGPREDIDKYAKQHWNGATSNSQTIREAYCAIPIRYNLKWLRVIRGDNYCAVRSVIYQALLPNFPIISEMHDSVVQQLHIFNGQSESYKYLQDWSFANRLPNDRNSVHEKAVTCVDHLFHLLHLTYQWGSDSDREEFLTEYLNQSEDDDVYIMEAIKILMMLDALKLHDLYAQDPKSVPDFVVDLYTRDDSRTPLAFFTNHLNEVGKTRHLEQLEMYLLAHTLSISIRVFRPSQFNKEDFIVDYKGLEPPTLDSVNLISEDDRHYDILLS